MTTICNAALPALALMGYSLPDWFKYLLVLGMIIGMIIMIFRIPKIIKMIINSFKE